MNTLLEDQRVISCHDRRADPDTSHQEPLTLQATILPAPADGLAGVALSHYEAALLASRLADDLALATWEDAEWR